MSATIKMTKDSHAQHSLEFIRNDGTKTRAELESRSVLRHDLAHYAVESVAKLKDSFWGMLDAGRDIQSFTKDSMATVSLEARITEMMAVQIQDSLKTLFDADRLTQSIKNAIESMSYEVPPYVTATCITEMHQLFRLLFTKWSNLKTGETLILDWE